MATLSSQSLHNDEEETDLERGKWDMGTGTNSRSFELESWSYVQHQNYHLQLLQKKDMQSDRPTIPATLNQRLSYYRSFVSAPSKTHVVYMQHDHLNHFFWNHICTLILKSLPSAYIALFMSSYVSDEHLYLAKMVPCFRGTSLGIIIAGFCDLLYSSDYIIMLFYYTCVGFIYKNPWNGCETDTFKIRNDNISCLTLSEFAAITMDVKPKVMPDYYISAKGQKFHMAPMIYFRKTREYLSGGGFFTYFSIYFIIIWTILSLNNRTIFTKYLWRLMHISQWTLISLLILATIHLAFVYFDHGSIYSNTKLQSSNQTYSFWRLEISLLAESITAPPIVHVVTSRSTGQINPGRDSGLIVASNSIYSIFRGVLTDRLKMHCETFVNVTLWFNRYNLYPWFYIWPIYFSTFYLGNIYTLIFFTSNLLVELVTFVITYQILVEVIIYEYPRLKRWMVVIMLYVLAIIMFLCTHIRSRFYLYAYTKSFSSLIEILVITWLYPLGRLIDDITFHSGSRPSGIRILSLKIVNIFYSVKLYYLFTEWITKLDPIIVKTLEQLWVWILTLAPLVLGFIYTVIKHMCVRKQNWRFLLQPKPNFGPRNHITRQLRKQFDRREYVTSQGSRYLSRYLMAKAEADTYKLDIRYDKARRSTFRTTDVPMKIE